MNSKPWIMLVLLAASNAAWSIGYCGPATSSAPIDSVEFASLLDAWLPGMLQKSDIPGATVVSVQSGRVLFRKGYGMANVAARQPMDPAQTIVRIASVSKPFTAVLVMQLVQSGALALADNAASHLGHVRIRNPFPEPVTIRHLLTHTAGLDKVDAGRTVRAESTPPDLESYLKHNTPPVIRVPGEVFAYSNHGFALAGEIVADVRHLPFSECADQFLFQPLDMRSSSFVIRPDLRHRLATGYRSGESGMIAQPVDLMNTVPASMMVTTADDMAKFMTFMLGDAPPEADAVLSASLRRDMERVQYRNHDALPSGYGFGFFIQDGADGTDWIWHDGDTRGWTAELDLYPAAHFGIFFAFNGDGGTDISARIVDSLRSRFFGFESRVPEHETRFQPSELDQLCGQYAYVNTSVSTREKFETLVTNPERVEVRGRDTLLFGQHAYTEIAPLVFQRTDDRHGLLAFRHSDGTGTLYAATGIRAYRKLMWHERPAVHRTVLMASVVGWFSVLFRLLFLIRRKYRGGLHRTDQLRWMVAGFVFVCFLVFTAGFVLISPGATLRYGVPTSLRILFAVAGAGAAASVSLPVLASLRWKTSYKNVRERYHYVVVTASAILFSAELVYWHFIL
jgi:CubicO group peptidase (beta-lactamase class C family)